MGCVTLQDETKQWMGHNKAELIRAWGPPISVHSDRQGGTVLYYHRGDGDSQAIVYMYAHQDGTLYDWRTP